MPTFFGLHVAQQSLLPLLAPVPGALGTAERPFDSANPPVVDIDLAGKAGSPGRRGAGTYIYNDRP